MGKNIFDNSFANCHLQTSGLQSNSAMNAGTFPPLTSSRSRSRAWRIAGTLIVILICIVAGLLLWLLSIARSALPKIDGTVAVAGLSAPVRVTRDAHGVPTIDALTTDDLFFAQGYVTAQDRLFQMDLLRRAAEGDLAEIVGEVAVKHDRQQRILGIRAAAEKGALAITAEDREPFGAFARGVNSFIQSYAGHLPLDFRILKYTPRPCKPVH
jgi:penicillin amidase